jgi:purine-nucleoside phosphorylase
MVFEGAANLYTLAAKYDCKSLANLTVSYHLKTGKGTTVKERETAFNDMFTIALETAVK